MNKSYIEYILNNIIKENKSEELNNLLKNKEISPDFEFENGYILLSKILYAKKPDLLNVLIEHGVDINKNYQTKNNKNNYYVAAMIPILEDDVETFDKLFKNGLDPKLTMKDGDYENDIFMSAITKNKKNILKYLIENKVRYDSPFVFSRRALTTKAERESYPMIILREIKSQEVVQFAIKNGYADNLDFTDLLKLTSGFISGKNYKNIEMLLPNILNRLSEHNKSFFVKHIFLEGSYIDTGNTYKKTIKLLDEHLKKQKFNSHEIVNIIDKVNFPAIELLLKNNQINNENAMHKDKSIYYKVMSIRSGGILSEDNKILYKEKISLALLNSVVDYKSDDKIFDYVKENHPEFVAAKERNELNEILTSPDNTLKEKLRKRL